MTGSFLNGGEPADNPLIAVRQVQRATSDLPELPIPVQRDPAAERRARKATSLLTPGEVAEIFRVDPKTVTRWHQNGTIDEDAAVRTPGNHRRYLRSWVEEQLMKGGIKTAKKAQEIIDQGLQRYSLRGYSHVDDRVA